MATYNDRINNTVHSPTFHDQVLYALAKKAAWIITQTTPPTPLPADWSQQVAWAKSMLYGNAQRWTDLALMHVATNEQINITATPADTDVEYMVEAFAIPVLVTMSLS